MLNESLNVVREELQIGQILVFFIRKISEKIDSQLKQEYNKLDVM